MDAGNRYSDWPLFIDSATRQRFRSLQKSGPGSRRTLCRRLKLFATDARTGKRYEGKLRIQTVVSRETAAGSLTGRIPALIESGELESAIGLPMNKETSHVMLCGNPQMVRDTQQLLKETRQMTKHLRRRPGHMTAEHYW